MFSLFLGDLLETKDVDIIVYHANCLCITPHGLSNRFEQRGTGGLSAKIVDRFPWANIYLTRRGDSSQNLAIVEDGDIPGTIQFFKSPNFLRPDIVGFLSP